MRTLLLLSSLISSSLWACPDLQGTYSTCRSTTGVTANTYDVVMTQETSEGITTFTMTSTNSSNNQRSTTTMRADGVTNTEVQSGSGLNLEIANTVSCKENESLKIKNDVTLNGQKLIKISTVVTKEDNSLVMNMSGNNMGKLFVDVVICE